MRIVLAGLLLINLVFFGWARWIDVPAPVSRTAAVPTLRLASSGTAAAGAGATTAACRSIGPLPDAVSADAAAAALLAARGLHATSRVVTGTADNGYWVYLPAIKSATERARVLARLKAAGVSDAVALVQTDHPEESDRISVGLFRDASHAQSRAAAVRRLGLAPVVEPRQDSVSRYWLDFPLPAGGQDPGIADIGQSPGVLRAVDNLRVIDCPATAAAGAAAVAAPGVSTAGGAATAGAAAASGTATATRTTPAPVAGH